METDDFPVSGVTDNLDPDSKNLLIVWAFPFPQGTDTKSMGRGPLRGELQKLLSLFPVSEIDKVLFLGILSSSPGNRFGVSDWLRSRLEIVTFYCVTSQPPDNT